MKAVHSEDRLEPFKVACSSCNLRELCMPVRVSSAQMERLDEIVASRRAVARGEALSRAGEAFSSLFAVRTSFVKTCVSSEEGRDQLTAFQMAGELLRLDGMGTDRHTCDAVALEDSPSGCRVQLIGAALQQHRQCASSGRAGPEEQKRQRVDSRG